MTRSAIERWKLKQLLADLEAKPGDARLLSAISELYREHGEAQLASSYLLVLGEIFARDGFFLKAIAVGKQAVHIDPLNAEAMLLLAQWHAALDLHAEAAEWRLKLPGG